MPQLISVEAELTLKRNFKMVLFKTVIHRKKTIRKWIERVKDKAEQKDLYRLLGIYHASIFGLCFYTVAYKINEDEKAILK